MATVDLGKLKPVWKGTWAGSTSYEKDDMVQEGVNSYICTIAHTSDASTFSNDSANWDTMATGANIPAQSGNSGNFLQTDGSSLSWASASSGVIQTVYAVNTTPMQQGGQTYQTIVQATITPTSSSNSIIVLAAGQGSYQNGNGDGTQRNHYYAIEAGGSTVTEWVHENYRYTSSVKLPTSVPVVYKHSPSTTSAITYSLRTKGTGGGWDSYWNQVTGGSTMILMEVTA